MTINQSAQVLVEQTVARLECEHIAALLKSLDELPPVVSSFLGVGAARNGWLVHGSRPGEAEADRVRLTDAGLDVAGLARRGQLEIMELDLTLAPDDWVRPWASLLRERLNAGFDALWFARFPVGADGEEISGVLPFEDAWMRCFKDHPVMTLCPYILHGMADDSSTHQNDIAAVHERVLDMRGGTVSAA